MCDMIKINYYKKDIVVKNSIKKQTYIDYETAHMFYETNLLNELPPEIYEDIMREVFKDYVMKIPAHIKNIMRGRWQNSFFTDAKEQDKKYFNIRKVFNPVFEHQVRVIKDNDLKCYTIENKNYNKKYKCKCKTHKGTWCSKDYNNGDYDFRLRPQKNMFNSRYNTNMSDLEFMGFYNDCRELITIKHLSNYHVSGIVVNGREIVDINLKLCGTHAKKIEKDPIKNIYDYYRNNGYIMRNGYVCKVKNLTYKD